MRIRDWSSDVCSSDLVLIDCEAARADELAKRLTLYRLRRPIVIGRDDALAVHWSAEGEAGSPDPRLAALGRLWIAITALMAGRLDRKSVVEGKSVSVRVNIGGRRIIKKKNN